MNNIKQAKCIICEDLCVLESCLCTGMELNVQYLVGLSWKNSSNYFFLISRTEIKVYLKVYLKRSLMNKINCKTVLNKHADSVCVFLFWVRVSVFLGTLMKRSSCPLGNSFHTTEPYTAYCTNTHRHTHWNTDTHITQGYNCPDTRNKRTVSPKILFSHTGYEITPLRCV